MPVISQGAFFLSPALVNGERDLDTEIPIVPSPTYVQYGDRIIYTLFQTEGRLIKQRSKLNPSEKRWVWENYNPAVPFYETMYWTLFNNQEHIRVSDNKSPYVYLKEDVTFSWGKIVNNQHNNDWLRCRLVLVSRELSERGGPTKFDKTEVLFTIDDPEFEVV